MSEDAERGESLASEILGGLRAFPEAGQLVPCRGRTRAPRGVNAPPRKLPPAGRRA